MPINACSVNTHSVDTVCWGKVKKYVDLVFGPNPPTPTTIIDVLFGTVTPPVPVAKKGHGGWTGYRPDFNTDTEEKFDPSTLEHLFITLTATFDGETVVTTWNNSPSQFRPMISINKLTTSPSEVHVEVTNLTILGKA